MTPQQEYQQRLAARRGEVEREDRQHIRLGNARLVTGLAGGVILWQVFVQRAWAAWWLLLPLALFVVLAVLHERVLRARTLAKRAVLFYDQGLARIEDRWAGTGETGSRFEDASHPYSDDLDLFGRGSLFELLSEARTRGGEDMLAGWLLAPSSADQIGERHQAVTELRQYLDLRESLFVMAQDVRDSVQTGTLVAWAESPAMMPQRLWPVAALLSLLVLASLAVLRAYGLAGPIAGSLAVVAAFGFWMRPRTLAVITHVDEAVHDLELLSQLLQRMERQTFRSTRLERIRQELVTRGATASERIARLHRLAELIDSRDNLAMRVLGPPLLYSTHLAFAVEHWRRESGEHVRHWIDALSELEALLSLAGYSYEHPQDPFPELVDRPELDGTHLGHPLLPEARCVRNSVRLAADASLLVVSGSNMSGKSTYLRTIGINVVLAMAGAPVRATRMVLGPMQLGASIRVTDSLQGGSSRFFAEITRLRKIVDLAAGERTVVFLLDELLNGTNSHDRRIGAEGILRELLHRGALGLVTTHDLALTAIAEALGAKARNVHFEDTLEGGKLHFDYRLREGVVQKSNALELMRSIGLDV